MNSIVKRYLLDKVAAETPTRIHCARHYRGGCRWLGALSVWGRGFALSGVCVGCRSAKQGCLPGLFIFNKKIVWALKFLYIHIRTQVKHLPETSGDGGGGGEPKCKRKNNLKFYWFWRFLSEQSFPQASPFFLPSSCSVLGSLFKVFSWVLKLPTANFTYQGLSSICLNQGKVKVGMRSQ